MNAAVKLQVGSVIGTIQVLPAGAGIPRKSAAEGELTGEWKKKMDGLSQSLDKAIRQIQAYGDELFATHRQQLSHLAVQIAERILARQIEQGQYNLEKIIADAMEQMPSSGPIEIQMNPDDVKILEKLIVEGTVKLPADVKLTSDWSIGRAECVIQTAQGAVEYVIKEHLKQIEAALAAA